MSYYFNKVLKGNFEEVVEKVKIAIQENGFGVVSEINMHEKFKDKLNVDFRKYKIIKSVSDLFGTLFEILIGVFK